ncbi:asparagine synthase (glutamine-hydrolyzing) [Sphingopyxis soli]|nr:asparagine synthase (glutamine-hydrolyzing) [Sphingopyxis soli]
MCGIAGFWRPSGLDRHALATLKAMTTAIRRRGPDADGAWVDTDRGVALGHRRLSIIDLSPGGAQPMESADGRYVIVYNGEIYNFADLRADLEAAGQAPGWRGHSDTEVLLAALSAWGLDRTLAALNGMFAFALWDRAEGRLSLARDRMGEKPLYHGWVGQGEQRTLLFASDLAALHAHPAFRPEIDPASVSQLLRFGHVPDPASVYRGVGKLAPGTRLTLSADGGEDAFVYWDTLSEYARAAGEARFRGDAIEAVDELERLLGNAVLRQSVADVPLGSFLSGGIDSSAVTALLQHNASGPVKSFSIGFSESAYDESPHARAVAAHLGTDHQELIVTPEDALAVIPDLPGIYSEPFADSSQIPTYLVARMAREQVTVALSGDAGDELFAGYNRHVHAHRSWPRLARIPRPLRRLAGRAMTAVSPARWDAAIGPLVARKAVGVGEKMHKAAGVIASRDGDALYATLISVNPDFRELLRHPSEKDGFEGRALEIVAGLPLPDRMMAMDAIHYLPGDILTKVDRAAMAVSLETRVPMLDVDVIRFAWSLPADMKLRDGVSKWPLREMLYRHVPRQLIERPKQGFGVPIHDWLRGPLREWAEGLLFDSAASLDEYFDRPAIAALWQRHLSGAGNHQHRLWPILMFQAWRARS